MEFLKYHIEALIFCAVKPITIGEIQNCLSEMFDAEVSDEDIYLTVEELVSKYDNDEFAFQIYHIGKGYQFLTKPAYQASIGILLKQQSKKRLSTAALETLSIIAYKQPVTKSSVEQIRGVGCDYAIQKLLEKSLVAIVGKEDSIGKPLLYGTSDKFMEYFGINSLDDLPTLKDFNKDENSIGEEDLERLNLTKEDLELMPANGDSSEDESTDEDNDDLPKLEGEND